MSRNYLVMALAFTVALASGGSEARMDAEEKVTVKQLRRIPPKTILWGKESEPRPGVVAKIDPPYSTPDPAQVEVWYFNVYTADTAKAADRLFRAWVESLPERVDVRLGPTTGGRRNRSPLQLDWEMHQALYFTGEVLGREMDVHDAIVRRIKRKGNHGLHSSRDAERLFRTLGIPGGTFAKWRDDPEVLARGMDASDMLWGMTRASLAAAGETIQARPFVHPNILVNGQHAITTYNTRDPRETFRIANWLIRRELEMPRGYGGPTNNEEFSEWMSSLSGEIVRRVSNGREVTGTKVVYNHWREEFWVLDGIGKVILNIPLVHTDSGAYFRLPERGGARYLNVWRFGRQYLSYEGDSGPQRYGAFLLTDWLSAPDMHWVELSFKGKPAALAFSPDGKVEARNERGPIFGSWWLEAGELHVSLAELGVESWPWMEAADQVGFETPPESLTPWKRGR